jgi:hypothetical protein
MGRLAVQIEDTGTGLEGLAFGGGLGAEPRGGFRRPFAFGQIDGGLVTQYGADVTVFTPSITLDATHKAILGVADKLASAGFLARVSQVFPGRTYSTFRVTMSKSGRQPFTAGDAALALRGAVTRQSLSIWNMVNVASEIVAFTAEAIPTAFSEKGRQQTFDTLKAAAGGLTEFATNPICGAIEGATGLKCKTVVVGTAVVVGLFFAWPVISPFITVGAERLAKRFR